MRSTVPSLLHRGSFALLAAVAGVGAAGAQGTLPGVGAAATEPCAAWLSGPTPVGADVRASAIYGGHLYVAGAGFGSTDSAHLVRIVGNTMQPVEGGPDNVVHALAVHNGLLYAGGEFVGAGTVNAAHIASWDGAVWRPLGPALGLDGMVRALAAHGGSLFAAGDFQGTPELNSPGIARWDGENWHSVGGGLIGEGARGWALESFGGELYLGGEFVGAGGVGASNVARWDGVNFAPVGGGLSGAVYALEGHAGSLYAGGAFVEPGLQAPQHIARLGAGGWLPLAGSVDDDVLALTSYGNDLVAGGKFQLATVGAGSFFGSVLTPHVARWNGAGWRPMGKGVDGDVRDLVVIDSTVLALGSFGLANGAPAGGVARWTDCGCGAWSKFPEGFTGTGQPTVQALLETPIGLVAGGFFTEIEGQLVRSVARWHEGMWHPMGEGLLGIVYAFTWHGGELYAGGGFQGVADPNARNVARFDGTEWRAVGSIPNLPVFALASYGGELVAGGQFSNFGGQTTLAAARWDGLSWKSLGLGLLGTVNALRVHGGALYAGGAFQSPGMSAASNVARWDGSQWSGLGLGTDGPVYALWSYEGDLAVGGAFDHAGPLEAHSVSLWSANTETWKPLGGGVADANTNQRVLALRHINGALVAAGLLREEFGGVADGAAIWNGTDWIELAGGFDNEVLALEYSGGDLVAGGHFALAGNLPAKSLARWAPCLHAAAEPFGAAVPAGSLQLALGSPRTGHSMAFTIDPVALAAPAPGLAWLYFSLAPDPAFPNGTWIGGFGFEPPHFQQTLIGLAPGQLLTPLGPKLWGGGPAAIDLTLSVPPTPALVGQFLFAQGLYYAPGQGASLTNGLVLLIGN